MKRAKIINNLKKFAKKDEGKQLITEAQKAGIKEADQVLADIKKEEAATTPSTQTTPKTNKK